MKLIDVNGNAHKLTPQQVTGMIIVGWVAFLLAGVMNIAYYKVHPSSVDFSPSRLWKKMFIYLLGKKLSMWPGIEHRQQGLIKFLFSILDSNQSFLEDDTLEMQNQTTSSQENLESRREIDPAV